jgi:hypothetical protein
MLADGIARHADFSAAGDGRVMGADERRETKRRAATWKRAATVHCSRKFRFLLRRLPRRTKKANLSA